MLLVLFAHAFLVSATHCHRFARAGAASAAHETRLGGRDDLNRPSESGGDAQCLLCRLQRNFVTDFNRVSLPVGTPRTEVRLNGLPPALSPITRAFSTPQGRAPPLA